MRTIPVDYLYSVLSYYAMLKQEGFHDPIDETIQHRFNRITGGAASQMITDRLENTPADEALFYSWLCRYLHSFSEEPINTIQISDRSYEWQHGEFTLTDENIIYNYSCNDNF